jgi:hypothetical protein
MKLSYRGVSYDYTPNPTPKMGPTIGTGTYRGHPVTFNAIAEMPEQPSADLTWRGVDYRSGVATPASVAVPSEVKTPVPVVEIRSEVKAPAPIAEVVEVPEKSILADGVTALARNLFIQHHQRSRRREQGMMVRLAAEVGIPVEEAAHYESHVQGKMPHDFSGYDRSTAAMS